MLILEKANVARLRDLYEKETDPLIKESIRFRLAEARLWHDVAEYKVLEPERIEQVKAKARHKVKYAIFLITIAVIVMIVCCGCIENTMRGAGNAVRGIGQLVTGVGTDVVRGVDGYSKEK